MIAERFPHFEDTRDPQRMISICSATVWLLHNAHATPCAHDSNTRSGTMHRSIDIHPSIFFRSSTAFSSALFTSVLLLIKAHQRL